MKATLLNRILLVLAFVGLFVAGVLSLEAGLNIEVPCGPSGGCAKVAAHPSSHIGPIPVAYIGFLGYLILAGLAGARSMVGVHKAKQLVTAGYVVAAVGTAASLYYQYVSFFVINATCLWCLSSALTMIVTLVVHALLAQELENSPNAPETAPKSDLTLLAALPVILLVGLGISAITMKRQGSAPETPKVDYSKIDFIPKDAHIFGEPTAKVTVVEFADILCPACQKRSPEVKHFVDDNKGKIRVVYRHFPLQMIHPQAMTAAAIAEVAADQGKFWDFILAVMGQKLEPKTPDELFQVAAQSGIDVTKAQDRLANANDPAYDRVARDLLTVKKLGLTSTPTFYIMVNGVVQGEPAGPGQIMDRLNDPKLRTIMDSPIG